MKVKINGKPHTVGVLRVLTRDGKGRPKQVEFVHEDEIVDVQALNAQGVVPQFLTVWVDRATWGAS